MIMTQATFAPRPRRPSCPRCRGWILFERWPAGYWQTCINCGFERWRATRRTYEHRRPRVVWGEQLGFALGDIARVTHQRRTA